MTALLVTLWKNEAGFAASAELVLIATIGVLSMIVGLSGVAYAVNVELQDVAMAFGTVNQSYRYSGLTGQSNGTNGNGSLDTADLLNGASGAINTNGTGPDLVSGF